LLATYSESQIDLDANANEIMKTLNEGEKNDEEIDDSDTEEVQEKVISTSEAIHMIAELKKYSIHSGNTKLFDTLINIDDIMADVLINKTVQKSITDYFCNQ
jgi:hypothetical protein